MKEKPHVLLVEDEPSIARVIKDSMEQKGYEVVHALDGKKGLNLFKNQLFSICIVDVMLPLTDGFTLVKQIRKVDTTVPVLFLTAKTATADVIEGYESGGNDYLKKPFSLEELFLRVSELLKRTGSKATSEPVEHTLGKFVFVPHRQTLRPAGQQEIKLSHRETQLLKMLFEYKNDLLDRKLALQNVWGNDSFFNARSMDVFISKLRKHLRQDPSIEILNIRGIGYKLIC